ncbi:mitochondrial outer membrane translocase complex, subunit Tom5 [Xylariales sp. AK1849]|nr:mitochondrial outer membrane translocase complex, subunit Tom5 [Xylariales sp. AK1849]
MFGFQPPQLTDEEIRELEVQAAFTVQTFAGISVALYFSPFVIDALSNIF